jgi:hypothetical protein
MKNLPDRIYNRLSKQENISKHEDIRILKRTTERN